MTQKKIVLNSNFVFPQQTRTSILNFTFATFKSYPSRYNSFRDVIEYDSDEVTKYFPTLFQSPPPMSVVSVDYSNMVKLLKSKIILSYSEQVSTFLTINQWTKKLEQIWSSLLKEKFVFNYQNVRERNASFEMDEILARWSSDFSYEMLKCHNRLKDDIIVSTAENIENTFERCKREIQDRSSSLLRKDEITIKNLL